ncbi:DUF302 domain-containing protein [Hyphomicrobium sp.]|uniref:DUF302 domain-containing protein n=1 Tax=Hyphomicrobium sp. TaxID=82 RepID=UPI000FC36721|nr:DUF302 domain-containing protein [Hyphomicrobium sp.]RUP07644.1 MAG: DUF302 domain-containing protein [Hyphomicrobium sp.]
MPAVKVSSTLIPVEHVRINCRRAFNEVRAALETDLPKLDEHIKVLLSNGDEGRIKEIEEHGPRLFMFLSRDHGELLGIAGRKRNAVQYEIGNPITASKMTRHNLGAALYAPLRVALFETEAGDVVFEYDRPSTLFGQFEDETISDVGRYLDHELEAALVKVAG